MEAFLIYLLKSSGIIALFLLCYMLFLKRETFFRTNRIYLLLGLVFSLLLPFLVITKTILVEAIPMFQEELSNEILVDPPVENPVDWVSLMMYAYGAGVLFFTFRFVIQLFSLKKLISKGKKLKDGKFILVEANQKSSPFSFFNYMVFNRALHDPQELDTIIVHEKVHARERHSFDILVMQLFTIFQWCNPLIWWYRRYLDDNLEYLADTYTIAQNLNKSDYQHLLLRTSIGENRYSVTTPFFNSSIKKRIIMLNKSRSNRKNSFKYALILPLLTGFIFLFNVRTEAQIKSVGSLDYLKPENTRDTIQKLYYINNGMTNIELADLRDEIANDGGELIIKKLERNKTAQIANLALTYKNVEQKIVSRSYVNSSGIAEIDFGTTRMNGQFIRSADDELMDTTIIKIYPSQSKKAPLNLAAGKGIGNSGLENIDTKASSTLFDGKEDNKGYFQKPHLDIGEPINQPESIQTIQMHGLTWKIDSSQ